MAITPRTVVRNPLLMLFFSAAAILAFTMFTCPSSKTRCHAKKSYQPPAAKVAAVKTVSQATVQAAQTAGHGWLGVEIQTLNAQRAQLAGVKTNSGVLVLGTQANRPAALAGLKPYDVIVRFDGQNMRSACHLKRAVANTAPNTRVPVTVNRQGRMFTFHPVLADKEGPRGCGAACR